ncbi:Lrp/AsnC ligand binding domain-containing protein [Vibrio sp. 10N.222.54.F12]|jgi:Lrp/AsnC family leucine-responsive transcriptional regulator|uniref:Leucine-responsive regulatory protein n=4 Tax=Vibrio TaxID=662 RepID=A0A2N7NL41_9VIBR|nr:MULTISPECIES: Lrp/AsnC ligand binding domain-containing protein [Vibrio]EAQ55770.1 Transcriptional regulator [Vibrio sp. MED222]MCZ4308416.1 Lrp/AsnC ligand binding domain-containing protein [Vibrio atlanticus]OEF48049.1 AsnC family transcriptional regulator [Vibrio tasmaniensis 1F-267]OEF71398.1 AsnC family transcriptional regulator [Vibrio tasmaniensis 1F-187]OEF87591.1 AsnC family transcriptional regulator [Vibrio tasmaniensis 1F-155]
MSQHQLDRIDKEILRILHMKGRLPVVELAKQVNLTTSPCSDRLKRLEKVGYITGYHAELCSEKLGLDVQVFIHIRLDQTSFSIFDKFAQAVETMPEVEECYSLSGDFDTMIKVRVKDMKAYQAFMATKLGTLPGVIQTRSEVVIEEHKKGFGVNPELLATIK